jgi:hypothetical protein
MKATRFDTVGVKVGPHTMIDRLGAPYTEALHVLERYRLIDAAVEAQARGVKEWTHIPAYDIDYKGKGLQLEFTVEDEGVFTIPWKGIITYRRAVRKFWDERICAENITNYEGRNYYSDKDAKPPQGRQARLLNGRNATGRFCRKVGKLGVTKIDARAAATPHGRLTSSLRVWHIPRCSIAFHDR